MYQIIFFQFRLALLAITFCIVSANSVYPQNRKIDSLRQVLSTAKNEAKADIFYELAYEYIIVDVAVASQFAKDSYSVSMEMGDSLRMVKAGRLLSSAYRRSEKLDSAVWIAEKVLAIALRNNFRDELKILYNSLAIAYSFRAEYDNALDYHFRSLIARERDGNKSEISITLNNIGFVYFKLNNYEKALEYYERSLDLKNEIKDTYDLDRVLINIGLCNIHIRNFDAALESITDGLSACGGNCTDEIRVEGEFGLGVANYGLGRSRRRGLRRRTAHGRWDLAYRS